MKQNLTAFLSGSPQPMRWLVIESPLYLKALRSLYPQANIMAVARNEEIAALSEWEPLHIEWRVMDYRRELLPFPEACFDAVLAENVLLEAYTPYETLMDISRKLTDVGTLYTSFQNIRYYKIFEGLQQGMFPLREEHFYAKQEVVKLLDDTLFKEIYFIPGEQEENSLGEAHWEAQGFENASHDLVTRSWLVKAGRSTANVANLKGLYSKEIRQELSRLLHRLEYDVETEKSLARLKALCEAEMIFPEYISDFIEETCIHKEKVRALFVRLFC